MRPAEILKILKSIRYLSKEHKEWGRVYKQYLVCLFLMGVIEIMRYMTECLLSVVLLYIVYMVLSHPPILNAVTSSSLYRAVVSFLTIPSHLTRMFFP